MNQPHIGYTGWKDPVHNIMPKLYDIQTIDNDCVGLVVEGDSVASTKDKPAVLPQFSNYPREKHYFELFARKSGNYAFTVESRQSWLIPSVSNGYIREDQRVEVAIDWTKAPKGDRIQGEMIVKTGNQSFRILVSLFNPAYPDRETVKGFVEANGYIAMEAEHFSTNKPANGVLWQRIAGYGRTLSSMMPLPVTTPSFTDLKNAPTLEYNCYLFTTGKIEINTLIAPTLNCLPDADMRFAIAIDDEQPQIVQIPRISITGLSDNQGWSQSVINNIRVCKTKHNIKTKGYHKVKVYMIDPVVTMQRIVINTGGLKQSFFYPPESFNNKYH